LRHSAPVSVKRVQLCHQRPMQEKLRNETSKGGSVRSHLGVHRSKLIGVGKPKSGKKGMPELEHKGYLRGKESPGNKRGKMRRGWFNQKKDDRHAHLKKKESGGKPLEIIVEQSLARYVPRKVNRKGYPGMGRTKKKERKEICQRHHAETKGEGFTSAQVSRANNRSPGHRLRKKTHRDRAEARKRSTTDFSKKKMVEESLNQLVRMWEASIKQCLDQEKI